MTSESDICVATFFRYIGKDVTTVEDFVMTTSLQMKWMSPSDSKVLLAHLEREGSIARDGDFIRPAGDISAVDVPLAYKPSNDLVTAMKGAPAPKPRDTKNDDGEPDMFHKLMDVAKEAGMEMREFIPSCNKIQKRLDIDIGVAALIVLRDRGIDISTYADEVYEYVRKS